MKFDAPIFLQLGVCMMQRHTATNSVPSTKKTRFQATFETSSENVPLLWALIILVIGMPEGAYPMQLLWVLFSLKISCSESINCTIARGSDGAVNKKTFQKWPWHFVLLILDLYPNVVSNESLAAYDQ